MDVNGPDSSESNKSANGFQRKSKNESRQIDYANRINGINRMFPMCGQPIKMLGTVMHFMKTPEESHMMLETMSPVNKKITQYHYLYRLKPPGLRGNAFAEGFRKDI